MQDEIIEQALARIRGGNTKLATVARQHLDSLTKPLGSLGRLEDVATQYVAWQEKLPPVVANKVVYTFAADHGVVAEGVSAYPKEVTPQMFLNIVDGGAGVNVLARHAGAKSIIVDVGVDADLPLSKKMVSRKVRRGTRNFAREAAMTEAECVAALHVGLEMADEAHRAGATLMALGELGIGNTTSAAAVAAAISGHSAAEMTGRGTGVDDERWRNKCALVERALDLHFPQRATQKPDAFEVLRRVGGLEVAAMTGAALGAASHRIAVVLDGFICTAAVAVACAMAPAMKDGLFAGHQSLEPGHRLLLQSLKLQPLLQLDMRLGEGSGAVLAFDIIEAAVAIYNQMATFNAAGVSQAN